MLILYNTLYYIRFTILSINFIRGNNMKRNPSIELCRLLACLIVIGVHTSLSAAVNEHSWDTFRLFLNCLLADGVAIFFMITGAFLFNNDYCRLLKKTLKHIIIPLIIFSIIGFYCFDWLFDKQPLSLHIAASKYIDTFRTLLSWQNPISHSVHLWYLYVYILVILIYPLLKAFVDYLDADTNRTKIFLIGTFIFLIMNDISSNSLGTFSHHSINALVPASIEIIWGHILYKYQKIFTRKLAIPVSIFLFFSLNYLRSLIQLHRYSLETPNNYILFWYSSIGIICASAIFIFCFSVIKAPVPSNIIQKFICWLASYTFPVYLIHIPIRDLLATYNVPTMLNHFMFSHFSEFIADILYNSSIVLIIFVICLIISILFRNIKKLLNKVIHCFA